MVRLEEVALSAWSLDRFATVAPDDSLRELKDVSSRVHQLMRRRTFWHVNSTSRGGGVAELLHCLLCYLRGVGIDARWTVIGGVSDFFAVTKRLHHALHGAKGDDTSLDSRARAVYEATLESNALALLRVVRPGDVVMLHDPQTAGLAPRLLAHGAHVIWRSHIGADQSNPHTVAGWQFLEPYLRGVRALVFSRAQYVPSSLHDRWVEIVPPSIDPFTPKNQELSPEVVRAILHRAGLIEDPTCTAAPSFVAEDGSTAVVTASAEVVRASSPSKPDVPLIVQVSRWDPLKDPVTLMRAFAMLCATSPTRAELLLVGPDVSAVSDDPEGAAVLASAVAAWRVLPHAVRQRVHLASLPMGHRQENAAIVNAVQRCASIVVQKSLQEGFGLTVTEAMWKRRPIVASAVGGLQDQIEDGVHGVLVRDPANPQETRAALAGLLADPARAERLAQRAHERVRAHFLMTRHLHQYLGIVERVLV